MGLSGDGPTILQGWRSGSFLLGLTTKHIYFAGSGKRFRVRYDRTMSFDSFDDGFGIMPDAQSARPQAFRTGDGWFPYNLAVNLSQIQG